MRSLLLVVGAVALGLWAATALAGVPEAVNWARVQGCPRPARAPLRDNAELESAARALAAGGSLSSVLAATGYIASESAAVHLSGARSDAAVAAALAARDCASLTQPALQDVGAQRRGGEVWIVLAAPAPLPGVADTRVIRAQILDLVNQARRTGYRCGGKAFAPVPPLAASPSLEAAALAHSRQMAAHQEFDHRGHDGSTPATRVAAAGYGAYSIVGENIAAGAMTPAEVTEGWLASPGHCENIMDPRFMEIGIAYAVNRASRELVYWTQDFAAPRRPRAPRHLSMTTTAP